MVDYIKFKQKNGDQADECRFCKYDEELIDCDRCNEQYEEGIVNLFPANQWVWDLAQSIRYLGAETVFALRDDLKLDVVEAHWLEIKLKLILSYVDSIEKNQQMEMMQFGIASIFGGGKKSSSGGHNLLAQ